MEKWSLAWAPDLHPRWPSAPWESRLKETSLSLQIYLYGRDVESDGLLASAIRRDLQIICHEIEEEGHLFPPITRTNYARESFEVEISQPAIPGQQRIRVERGDLLTFLRHVGTLYSIDRYGPREFSAYMKKYDRRMGKLCLTFFWWPSLTFFLHLAEFCEARYLSELWLAKVLTDENV